jgi:tatD family deoxyribonuclease
VDHIATLRGLTTEEVAQATYDNARKVFGLD